MRPTWIEIYPKEVIGLDSLVVVGWNNDVAITTGEVLTVNELLSILSDFPKEIRVTIAPAGKTPPLLETDLTLKGRFVVIDPGHSERRVGARGKNGVEEENLNRLQATVVANRLSAKGAKVEIVDPLDDDLIQIGKRANASDMFLSLHHNAYDGKQHYVCVLVHKKYASEISNQFASICAQKVAKSLNLPLYKTGANRPGVMPASVSVLNSAENSSPSGPCVLVESYFVDALDDVKRAEEMTTKAGHAIAEAAEEWMSDTTLLPEADS